MFVRRDAEVPLEKKDGVSMKKEVTHMNK